MWVCQQKYPQLTDVLCFVTANLTLASEASSHCNCQDDVIHKKSTLCRGTHSTGGHRPDVLPQENEGV